MAEEIKVIRVGDILTNLIDPVTKLSVQYSKVLNWYDGTPMTDAKLDSYGIYVKKGSEYFLKSLGEYGQVLQKNTMTEMRNLSGLEILLLRMGYYNSVQLNGYYQEGDTPAPINYIISTTTEEDDGGSVIEVGGIKLEHNFNNYFDLRYFGIKQDDSISEYYNKIISKVSGAATIKIPEGNFICSSDIELKSDVNIEGVSIDKTVIYSTSARQHIFKSKALTYKPDTTLTQDVLTGDKEIFLSDTSGISSGDFIIIKSTQRFTRLWDGGTEIRPYYTDGELLKVISVTSTSVVIESNCYLAFPQSSSTVKVFSPSGIRGSIKNLTLRNVKNTTTGSNCIYLSGWDGIQIDNVKTENSNLHGLGLFACYRTNIGYIETNGGTADLGLNYGVMIADGTKYTNINNIKATNCRHGLAGGGTGLACSMYATVNNIVVSESQNYSVDTHANTAFFTVKNAYVDNFYSFSGIGHNMEYIISSKLTYAGLAIEGGYKCKLGYGYVESAGDFFLRNAWVEFQIDYLEFNYGSITSNDFRLFWMPAGSINNKIGTLVIRNRYFNSADSVEDNFNRLYANTRYAVTLRDGTVANNIIVDGFPRGINCFGVNITINNISTKNTGWSPTTGYDAQVLNAGGGSHNLTLKSMYINNADLPNSYTTRTYLLSFTGGSAVQTLNTSLSNIVYIGGNVLHKIYRSTFFQDFILVGNKLGSGTGSVSTLVGKFYGNDFISDSIPTQIATTTQVGMVKMAPKVDDITASDMVAISTPDATDEATAITLVNAIKGWINGAGGVVVRMNSHKNKINEMLNSDRTSGQRSTT